MMNLPPAFTVGDIVGNHRKRTVFQACLMNSADAPLAISYKLCDCPFAREVWLSTLSLRRDVA